MSGEADLDQSAKGTSIFFGRTCKNMFGFAVSRILYYLVLPIPVESDPERNASDEGVPFIESSAGSDGDAPKARHVILV